MAAGQVVTRIVWISLALFWCHAAQGVRLDWNDVEKTMVYGIEKRIYPGYPAIRNYIAVWCVLVHFQTLHHRIGCRLFTIDIGYVLNEQISLCAVL